VQVVAALAALDYLLVLVEHLLITQVVVVAVLTLVLPEPVAQVVVVVARHRPLVVPALLTLEAVEVEHQDLVALLAVLVVQALC
jgi:2-keto-3-deoxy-L-rhamnonate aldolase RhmA